MKTYVVAISFLFLGVMLSSGCSSFKSSTRMDMGPFAENTTAMLAEAQEVLQPLPWKHLRRYQIQARNDKELQGEIDAVRGIFRGIGIYSIQVVSLNASRMSDPERAHLLADYFDDVLQPILDAGMEGEIGLTRGMVDTTLANIRKAPTYMEAIRAADPMVYTIVQFTIQRIDRVEAKTTPGFDRVTSLVEAGFEPTRAEIARLDSTEAADVRTYLALQDYRVGKGTREAVIAADPLLAHVLAGKNEVTEYEEAQRILRERLAATDATRAQLLPRQAQYRDEIGEVVDLGIELQRRTRAARMMLVYWLRAHRNLSQGVQVPPAINVGGMLGSSAKKAIGAVTP
ncbi:MAG TPA: hypothetical protein VFH88_09130 [Candidatus Krumholzibacteria bacterium]|nr:hypothetical protein [Candidatus Krumholzibacteria bacterium]